MHASRLLVPVLGLAGLCQPAAAADDTVFINRITTEARVDRDELAPRPGAVRTRVAADFDGGVSIDAYARLDDDNTAFQSAAGINAVQVRAAISNGYPLNYLRASTTYTLSVTTGPVGQSIFLDYLVFPGVVGLPRFGNAGSKARIAYEVAVIDPLRFGTGASGQVMLEQVRQGLGVVTQSTVDPEFAAAGFRGGTTAIDGLNVDTLETQAFLATAFLGFYQPFTLVEIAYRMSAEIQIPGYEVAAIARVGDPFALRADAQAELDKYFPGSDVPFRVRAEAVAVVPEPGVWWLLAVGLACLILGGVIRRMARR